MTSRAKRPLEDPGGCRESVAIAEDKIDRKEKANGMPLDRRELFTLVAASVVAAVLCAYFICIAL